ncbi:MAG TPA: VWA domain-containing protein [Vicinamibacteria bacterium]|nr:VWA domain-containing protein [Vicinamibacteria bacterium]
MLLLGLALASAPLSAQAPSEPPREVPTFGTGTELVYVRFHVEKKGRYLRSVTRDQIRVLEDGQPQEIVLLETPATRERTVPPEVTLALDVSSSVMEEGLLDEALVKEVLFATLGDQARVGLCAFGGELRCPTPPTRDPETLLEGLREAIRFGHETRHRGTRLYASLADISRKAAEGEKSQRAVIVFSDGLDTEGGKMDDAVEAAQAADVRVYTVALSQAFMATARGARPFGMANRTMYDYKKLEFGQMAEETGGRGYEPATLDPKSLSKVLTNIATEISTENVVGYQPKGAPTGRKHKVKVELVDKSIGRIDDGERTLVR